MNPAVFSKSAVFTLLMILLPLPSVEALGVTWQQLEKQIPHLDYGEFLYARPSHRRDEETVTALKTIEAAMAPAISLKQLQKLALIRIPGSELWPS